MHIIDDKIEIKLKRFNRRIGCKIKILEKTQNDKIHDNFVLNTMFILQMCKNYSFEPTVHSLT